MAGFLKGVLSLIWVSQVIMRCAQEGGASEEKKSCARRIKISGRDIKVAKMNSRKLKIAHVGIGL